MVFIVVGNGLMVIVINGGYELMVNSWLEIGLILIMVVPSITTNDYQFLLIMVIIETSSNNGD